MNKKVAIVFVIVMCMLQFVLMGYFNYMYVSNANFLDIGKYYKWFLIVQLGLNEVVVFSVGFLIYFKEEIQRTKSVLITSILLLISVVILFISGLYLGISFDIFTSGISIMYKYYLNIFYVIYAIAFLIFMISIYRSNLLESLPKLLVILMFSLIVIIYVYSSFYFGWFAQLLNDPSKNRPIRYLIGVIIMYPLHISLYVVSGLYILKPFRERHEHKLESNNV